jgi:hypothetical protein
MAMRIITFIKVLFLFYQSIEVKAQVVSEVDNAVFTNMNNHHSMSESGNDSIVSSRGELPVPVTKDESLIGRNRRLQIFGGEVDQRCEQLMDNTLEDIFAPKDCTCNQVGFPPKLVMDCERIEESCIQRRFTDSPDDNLLCGSPGLRITMNVWSIAFGGSPVTAEVCFYDTRIFNVTVPDIINPVCIGIFSGLPGSVPLANLLGLVFGRTVIPSNSLQETSKPSSSFLKKQRGFRTSEKSCVPIIGKNKDKCNSCKVCSQESGGGLMFDCGNVVPDFISTECTILPTFV